jgi:hypothetical protein
MVAEGPVAGRRPATGPSPAVLIFFSHVFKFSRSEVMAENVLISNLGVTHK